MTSRHEGGSAKTIVVDGISLCGSFVLATAVISVPFALGAPSEGDVDTGNPVAWWTKATQLFLWCLPGVVLVGALYAAPLLLRVRSRMNTAATLLLSVPIGALPAVALALVSALVPGLGHLVILAGPVGVLGMAISFSGTAIWLALRARR